MNSRQLIKLGVPECCCEYAIKGIRSAAESGALRSMKLQPLIVSIVALPEKFVDINFFGDLAKAIIEDNKELIPREPAPYKTWGADGIEKTAFDQMDMACKVPSAIRGSLMPDAHTGYGLPIGGVLATEGTVIPYAVGMDIACRMKISVLDTPIEDLKADRNFEQFRFAIEKGTRFGVGASYENNHQQYHEIMDDERWYATNLLKSLKNDKAYNQLGTSGSGNHFVEFGILTVNTPNNIMGVPCGQYVALLSHGGSRRPGYDVCKHYNRIAISSIPKKMQKEFSRLAWLNMESEAGKEYWLSMNLMGDYASANHEVIHKNVSKYLGAKLVASVENHHNFAWLEEHDGKQLVVHRKGATPAAIGDFGVIPGDMENHAYIVEGKGNADSLNSASHGAGRVLSRKKAKAKYIFKDVVKELAEKGIRIISAGADEVPGVYKDIEVVMKQQSDLVDKIARFDPKIVKMSGD